MTATSVTGKGLGSADKLHKGSEHTRIGAEKIIGPRIVWADFVTLDSSGDATVVLPTLTGVSADYGVMITDAGAAAAAACAASVVVAASATTLTLKGPASGSVFVVLVKVGLAV